MIIGAQLYSVCDRCKTQEGIKETFKAIAEMGYKSVQLSGFNYEPVATKEAADEYGLHIGLTHTDCKMILEETDKVIQMHKIIGADVVGVGGASGYDVSSVEDCRRFIKDYETAVKKLSDAGLRFAYHNHYKEYTRNQDGLCPMDVFYNETKWNFTFDTGWADFAGEDAVKEIERFADRLEYVHLKDFRAAKEENENPVYRIVPIYYGQTPIDEICKALEKAGTRVAYVEQDNAQWTETGSLNEMKKSIEGLKAHGWVK